MGVEGEMFCWEITLHFLREYQRILTLRERQVKRKGG